LILLAFLLPFSIYLLVLGMVNRRPHPLLVPGTWDFVGLVFAASGFLLVGGPAVLSSGSEGWRMFWLFGSRDALHAGGDGTLALWPLLAAVYFVAVVGGVVYLLFRRRELTAVYNVEPEAFEKALARVFGVLGLNPLRSGNLFVFGAGGAAIQLPHTAGAERPAGDVPRKSEAGLAGQGAVLEVEPFALLRHVTLRWEPSSSLLRREVEAELARTLAETHVSDHAVGDWLVLVAMGLIAFNLLATFGLTLSNFLRR
jgi:hypothetical protein